MTMRISSAYACPSVGIKRNKSQVFRILQPQMLAQNVLTLIKANWLIQTTNITSKFVVGMRMQIDIAYESVKRNFIFKYAAWCSSIVRKDASISLIHDKVGVQINCSLSCSTTIKLHIMRCADGMSRLTWMIPVSSSLRF